MKLTPGAIVRVVMGDRGFRPIGRLYRRVFVDLDRVADAIGPIPSTAHVLDVGGGDGDLINRLLVRFRDVRVTMIDIAPAVGGWIAPELEARTKRMPETSIAAYESSKVRVDFVMVNDVFHHVPVAARGAFADDLARIVVRDRATLLVKDIEPGSFRASLSRWADRYVTGDRHVELVDRAAMVALLAPRLPGYEVEDSQLFVHDSPNYLIRFAPKR